MKKRTIISLLLVACLATMCFVGGTFAKYTSTVTGTDEAVVAKWAFKQDGTEIDLAAPITFDLFANSVLDVDDKNDNNDVVAGKLAPGTQGSFALNIENASEVTATYDVTFTVDNAKNIPVKFYKDANMTEEITIADAKYSAGSGTLELNGTKTATVTVYWKWAFEGTNVATDDVTDTNLGIMGEAARIAVTATCKFTQVD